MKSNKKKKILVTGVLGFIFSNFIKKAVNQFEEYLFVGIDMAFKTYNLENMFEHPNYKFYLGDIADAHFINNVFELEKPDIIINGAAQSFVDDSITDIMPFLHSNVIGVQTLVNAALKYNVERFIHISTDEVLGQQFSLDDIPWSEKSPLLPRNPYACSKACSELIINSAHLTHKLQYNITRSCNVYGPYQKKENLIPHIIHSLINNTPIHLHGNGLNFRQYIYVDDKINAIMSIIKNGKINEIYNISDNNYYSNIDMVNFISKKFFKTPEIEYITDRKAHDFGYNLSNNKIKQLNWKPEMEFDKGMNKTIEWYKNKLGYKE